MTDRDLLERAATAAGYKWKKIQERDNAGINALWLLNQDGTLVHTGWDPLEDDGAALRLAVKLRISIFDIGKAHDGRLAAVTEHAGNWIWEPVVSDENAATRRAIVLAAAGIERGTNDE